MKITDVRCAIIGDHPVIRITTDEGIDGIGGAESPRNQPFFKPQIQYYRDMILGLDPTDVERVLLHIRRVGAFKPWGSGVSAIEIALWDIAGKAAGVPIYKLLGGKIRDRIRVYNGNIRTPFEGYQPEDFAKNMKWMKDLPQNFSIIKQGITFHGSPMVRDMPDFYYGDYVPKPMYPNRGLMTEKGFNLTVDCVIAMKEVLGDEVGLALDCGPGMAVSDTLKLAQALEPYNLMWMEDTITGDYTPYVHPDYFLQVTPYTSTPIHTGEQVYLRHGFKELIEKHAVDVIGPDPMDVGGIAELKWIAEFADLHGIQMAPHGTVDGLIGLAAHVQVGATLPDNFIAFELPNGKPDWWYDILEGMDNLVVEDSHIAVNDTPGLGISFRVDEAKQYLSEEDAGFFDD
ncbi:MAG: mandelate racemase/muconate lactonizing enzyme family protein [Chloroflexota bacterium]|jgi:L-alanine-DL-glutamate epimerase-like enolase superfamily enzyme|nr:mandelate racemase/muconate lactonizing enzyme family protein [Chloroflexota bacterium]